MKTHAMARPHMDELERLQEWTAIVSCYVVELTIRIYLETDRVTRAIHEAQLHRLSVQLRPWRARQTELLRLLGGGLPVQRP